MIIAVDPPPPLQIPANPYFPPFVLNADNKLWTILAPLIPIGWPKATAPPKTLTFLSEISNNLELAKTTKENASLYSKKSIASMPNPDLANTLLVAYCGAMEKSTGYISASAYAIILAKGLTFKAFTFSYDIKTMAHAPSLIFEAFAAVIVPVLLKAGGNWANLLSLYLFGSSS